MPHLCTKEINRPWTTDGWLRIRVNDRYSYRRILLLYSSSSFTPGKSSPEHRGYAVVRLSPVGGMLVTPTASITGLKQTTACSPCGPELLFCYSAVPRSTPQGHSSDLQTKPQASDTPE